MPDTRRYISPCTTNDTIVALAADIGEAVGSLLVREGVQANPKLRRENRIRTIQASLAMESNTLTILVKDAEWMSLSHRPTFRKNHINPALEAGLIERTIPERPNSQHQKYRRRKPSSPEFGDTRAAP